MKHDNINYLLHHNASTIDSTLAFVDFTDRLHNFTNITKSSGLHMYIPADQNIALTKTLKKLFCQLNLFSVSRVVLAIHILNFTPRICNIFLIFSFLTSSTAQKRNCHRYIRMPRQLFDNEAKSSTIPKSKTSN